ncbi:MAG: GxxExxY protein, partial [Opitutus sp.]
GYGLGEEIYQECMEIELGLRRIPYSAKRELACYYKGQELHKRYIPDLFVYENVIAELKAVRNLLPEHEAQLVNYLRLTRQPVGYLINFGNGNELEWKRVIFSEFIRDQESAPISEN